MLTYVRTYEITYDSPTRDKIAQLNTYLFKNGVKSANKYSPDVNPEHYGMQEYEEKESTYYIDMMGEIAVLDFIYHSDAKNVYEALASTFPDGDIHMYEESTSKKGERELGPRGDFLIHSDYDYCLRYYNPKHTIDDDVTVVATLTTGYNDTKLKFTITWCSEKVARKAKIDQKCVEAPLGIMGKIQHAVEKSLKTNYEWDISIFDNAEIDCHFDAISESRSECTPDIIERVRAEKKKNEEEE